MGIILDLTSCHPLINVWPTLKEMLIANKVKGNVEKVLLNPIS